MHKLVSAALVLMLTNTGLQSGYGDIYRKQLSDEQNLALLNVAGDSINNIGSTYKKYSNDVGECPICLDDFRQHIAAHPHRSVLTCGLDSQESSEVQNNSSKKGVIACKNKHGICVPCFYNPNNPPACSLCREPLRYNQYNTCLQCGTGNDLHFTHCKSCGAVSVTCSTCKTLSCCGEIKKVVAPEEHAPIKKQAEALIKRCRKEHQEYYAAQLDEMKRIIDEREAKDILEVEKTREQMEDLKEKVIEVEALMKKGSGDLVALNDQRRKYASQGIACYKVMKQKTTIFQKFKADTRAHYEGKIKRFADQKKREEESIRKMAKDATGSDLVAPNPVHSSPIIAFLSDLFN